MGRFYSGSDPRFSTRNPNSDNEEAPCAFGFAGKTKQIKDSWPKKKKNQVLLECYAGTGDEENREQGLKGVTRTKSLTDEDLDELKGCVDLGFGFSYEEIPELCHTLPALELCCSMDQKFSDEHHSSPESSAATSTNAQCTPPSAIANWKISSPGDHPDEVKARLKFWAQTVACTIRLCS